MDEPIDRAVDQQRRVLDFMLDLLGLREAADEAAPLACLEPLHDIVSTLFTENVALRAQICAFERQLVATTEELDRRDRELALRAWRGHREADGI